MERFFGSRRITLYASGTAALAQAMADCASRSSVKTPEIIVPAYSCPDLVAACVHASVYPRLVDVARSVWSYDLEALNSSLSGNTVAIVAINLLGVGDSSAELIRVCKDRHIPLIQDSAQYLPRESIDWPGEYVVLSFGRGKPLNLLHGGALIAPFVDRGSVAVRPAHYTARARLLDSRAAAVAFNTLTRPTIYRILSALPGTGLGEVIYKPLTNPAPLPEQAWQRVATAFELYRQSPSYRRDIWAGALEEWSRLGIVDLDCPGLPLQAEPLRLPLLAPDRTARDTLVDNLNRAGLGASRFYDTDLTKVAAVPEMVKLQGPFPNASALADQLFTLPTHSFVNADTVSTARELVLAWHRQHEGARTRPS
ncbi:MAG TPA: DegT/DnrJ/EryC1/StrS family aminotransferase [Steroidobacteraceae bacterium]|jgi:dTDP-4-amino-4,6-dideoxygalactose transaminase|nr:DegT/DnrJ/EryC1/StrS family aminotransferase [Steroidobacteraceae bacterium]